MRMKGSVPAGALLGEIEATLGVGFGVGVGAGVGVGPVGVAPDPELQPAMPTQRPRASIAGAITATTLMQLTVATATEWAEAQGRKTLFAALKAPLFHLPRREWIVTLASAILCAGTHSFISFSRRN
jgi:hypothetical protein